MKLSHRSGLVAVASAIALINACPAFGQSLTRAVEIDQKSGPLRDALMGVAKATNVQILFTSDLVNGRTAPSIKGLYDPVEALRILLEGTGIEARATPAGALVLQRRAPGNERGGSEPISEPVLVEEVVVGSNVRGADRGASALVQLDREAFERDGHATVADALSALPQAFGGTASDDATTTGLDTTGTNSARASGVNLRGLGADATLVLVNGRRMAGTGIKGDFADVSAIPMAAVRRVDVLLDGASALYGSDAVAGVVNIVLRNDFEGAETRAVVGGSTRGDAFNLLASQVVGRRFSGGHVMAAYEYRQRDALPGLRRPYAGQADLRPLGGTDRRRNLSQPGNILRPGPVTGQQVPAFAIPSSQNGVGLTPRDFVAGAVNLENWRAAYDVLPAQERHSGLLSTGLTLGRTGLAADVRYSHRRFETRGSASSATLTVNRTNPFFVSPTGAASERIAYSFLNELGGSRAIGSSESFGATLSAVVDMGSDWTLDVHAVHAEEAGRNRTTNTVNTAYLNEALGALADNSATPFSAPRDGYFNPFIGQGRNAETVLAFVGAGYDRRDTLSTLQSVNLAADGPLWTLPGGQLRVALGAQLRDEFLKTSGSQLLSTIAPIATLSRRGGRTVSAVFGEARLPVFGKANARPGLESLELTAAFRQEHHENIGDSRTPKLGLAWSPVRGLTARAAWGRSFRAPSIGELTDPLTVTPVFLNRASGPQVLTLLLFGGNPDLKPERATTFSAGVRWAPPSLEGLQVDLGYFDTRFDGRIGAPASENTAIVLTAPEFAAFRQFVSPASNESDRQRLEALINSPGSYAVGLFDTRAYGAIADARFANTAQLQVRGFDLDASFAQRLASGRLVLRLVGTHLIEFERRITADARAVDLAGLVNNPSSTRGRLSATWSGGPVDLTLGLNHVSRSRAETGRKVESWNTGDLQARYTPARGVLNGVAIGLSIQNLTDEDPPFYDSRLAVGYDAANADPLGRTLALTLSRAW